MGKRSGSGYGTPGLPPLESGRGKRGRRRTGCLAALLAALVCAALIAALFWDDAARIVFPFDYEEEISAYSAEYFLDPHLVAALIRTESGFDPDALSRAGAMGLMQIVPETGIWIAGKLGVVDFEVDMLYVPELNIRFGCYYLRYLLDYFSVTGTALAAYNAGMGTVSDWLGDRAYSSDGVSLDSIPYPETARYVEKIARYTEIYRVLYK